MKSSRLVELKDYYHTHLLEDVVGFWTPRTGDRDHGGFLTRFDRKGVCFGTDKNIWCQGRQTFLFAELYRHLGRKPEWLELARLGRDFLAGPAHAGEGRWHYLLDRRGNVLTPDRSVFTDCFALMGLCAFALASGSDEDRPLIERGVAKLFEHSRTPGFAEFHHFDLDPSMQWHAASMVIAGAAPLFAEVLGVEAVQPVADEAVRRVLYLFAKDEYQALFEALDADGHVPDTTKGRIVNPGHALESAWFCLEWARRTNNRDFIERAAQVIDWSYNLGCDSKEGGLLAFVDPQGARPAGPELMAPWGEYWDTKIWWVHSEALNAMLLCALETDDATAFERFESLHRYCRDRFFDREYGEWYSYLYRHGEVMSAEKGSWIRCAFHVPRNLLNIYRLLQSHAPGGDDR